ncbi:hypothetical protein DL95DRAFT_307163, partial [Leptodontidium sp. 2 PMI_412]
LDSSNIKSQRQLAKEHRVAKSSLQDRIKGCKSKAEDAELRQRLTPLEEDTLID